MTRRRDAFLPIRLAVRFSIVGSMAAAAAAATLLLSDGSGLGAQAAGPCDPPNGNPIVCENQKVGNLSSEWDISGAGDPTIQGFTTDISVNRGETISFKINASVADYRLDIYRMGYYSGMGARRVATVNRSGLLQTQPNCLSDAMTGLVDCGNWTVSTSWAVPADAVSGIYFAKAIRTDTGGASHIFFAVRDDAGTADVLFQTSDTTWQAYNEYGGNSLYVGAPATNPARAYKVSYNRPFTTRATAPQDWVFNAEYPMVRWLEANGYNVAYASGLDTDRSGARILQHKTFLSVGHDEYWSAAQRANVEAARAAGVHLAFFSGNEIFWKTRWENSISAPATAARTLVSYKETHADAKIDPQVSVWTGSWEDPRFSPPADGGRPANALTGTLFRAINGTTAIRVPADDGKMRFWRNTSVAGLPPGGTAALAPETLGYEWDEDVDNAFRPAGLMRLSNTAVSGVQRLQDYGSSYAPATANHSMTLYRHASGALVFGAGTVQWSWGLDHSHDLGTGAPSLEMQQATVNLLADMGVQPLTIQPGLFGAAASTDLAAPASAITSPASAGVVAANSTILMTGTAADAGGGQVGGVEVSTDGGISWHRAIGRENWIYLWQSGAPRTVTLRSRAVDDSGNIETPLSGTTLEVGNVPVSCPCSIWIPGQTPASAAAPDQSAVELGTRFRSDSAGYITALRFYQSSQDAGTHTGSLWSADGARLATATFASQPGAGWREATLGNPVAISADTTYIASYHTDAGAFIREDAYFRSSGVDNGPLHAPQNTTAESNGVFRYGTTSVFPDETSNSSNYWADVVFNPSTVADTTPPTISSVTPPAAASGVAADLTATATFNENVDPTTINATTMELRDSTNALVSSAVTYAAGSRTAALQPIAMLSYSTTYTARVKGLSAGVTDTAGNPLAADVTWSFTTTAPPPPPPTTGPGGPILVIKSSANPFSEYYAEILRAEGLNAFNVVDVVSVTPTDLNAYDVVILGDLPLTTGQVAMLSDWVTAGGNLIAMRPDKKLASLLGLVDSAFSISDTYLRVDTAQAPGIGIVGQTMQFHGTADRYTLGGATAIASLYSDAGTATVNPAVTIRSVGSAGGQAAAFTYDLARSVVYTRQGNPLWSGQERDTIVPVRSDDLFFGGAQANYVDLTKVAIPQADEQQRLLANLIGFMNLDRKPLPKFWYLPRGLKAAVVMTGDDHANNGTVGRFNIFNNDSTPGCSVADWECIRGTSYIFPNTPITAPQVAAFAAQGFEIGVHMWMSGLEGGSDSPTNDCHDFTPASIAADYAKQLARFSSLFPSALPLRTNRTHCIVWSDYSTQAQVELANGIRLDTNYYYWPASWVNDIPGLFTGSGMPMRFARADGTMIDVYQAASQMTDESDQSFPLTINKLLDRALGPEGYYGTFVANMHTDTAVHPGSEAIIASAQARGVPVISARQLLTWLDGRNGSSFGGFSWDGITLGFSVSVATGANNLQALLPATFGIKTMTGLTRDGVQVPYSTQTIKGVSYASFASGAGVYQAVYLLDSTPPVISAVTVMPETASAVVAWATDEAATTRVDYGVTPSALGQTAAAAGLSTVHSLQLTGLAPSTIYYYRVTSENAAGIATTQPAPPSAPATFTTSAPADLSCPCTIWPVSSVPAHPSVSDPNAVELGLKLRANVAGSITGIRFYRGTANIGAHTGSVWSTAGTLLGSVAFSNETASGWQEATLATPVAVAANITYIVSYHTSSGFYAGDTSYFQSAGVTRGPLTALANGLDGPNGVYLYGSGGFPNQTATSVNYWVDVVFDNAVVGDSTPPTVSATTPANGTSGVTPTAAITATFNEDVNPSTVTAANIELRDDANGLVASAISYAQSTRTVTLQPAGVLSASATYMARVRGGPTGIRDIAGNALVLDRTWSFTTTTTLPADMLWTNSAVSNAITAVDKTSGALIRQFNPGKGSGSGIVVVGNRVYYTVRGSGNVYRLDATTGADLGVAFAVPGQTALHQLGFDGVNFWISYGTGTVLYVTPAGIILRTIILTPCASACEGVEYFDGKLILGRSTGANSAAYDIYDTTGILARADFIRSDRAVRGLAYDGSFFYVSGSSTIGVYDGSTGEFLRTLAPGGAGQNYDDLSFEYVTNRPAVSPTRGDFDGDGRADVAVFHPTDGFWHVLSSGTNFSSDSAYHWGVSTDILVPGDYDGDRRTDVAIYRPSTGTWWLLMSGSNYTNWVSYHWGITDDVPVPADYDGDGRTDIAIYRPSDGTWWIVQSSQANAFVSYQWGTGGDVPVPADYDGDGKADLAIYRPATGTWWILQSSTNASSFVSYRWGEAGDLPVPADYDGDGKTDLAIYRPTSGTWWILQSTANSVGYFSYQWGIANDLPVPADYDRDGRADIAIFRPSDGTWYIVDSSTGRWLRH